MQQLQPPQIVQPVFVDTDPVIPTALFSGLTSTVPSLHAAMPSVLGGTPLLDVQPVSLPPNSFLVSQ